MTLNEVSAIIADGNSLSKSVVKKVLDDFCDVVLGELVKNNTVYISKLGKFRLAERKGRKLYNKMTNKEIVIPQKKVIAFKCAKKVTEYLNNGKGK